MAPSKSLASPLPDRANGHHYAHLCSQAGSPTDTAHPSQIVCGPVKDWGPLIDPSTIDAAPPLDAWSTGMAHSAHGHTANPPKHEAQLAPPRVVRLHTKTPVEPCKLVARSAGRSHSDAAPMATIIEQGSASTLDRHGSLLPVDPYFPLRAVGSCHNEALKHYTWHSEHGSLPHNERHQRIIRNGFVDSSREGIGPVHLGVPTVEEDLDISPALASQLWSGTKRLRGLIHNIMASIRGGTDINSRLLPSGDRNVPRRRRLTLRSNTSKNTALARATDEGTGDSEAPKLRSFGTTPITPVQPNSFLHAQGLEPLVGECPKTPSDSGAWISQAYSLRLETRSHSPSAIRLDLRSNGTPRDDPSILNRRPSLPYTDQRESTFVGRSNENVVTRNNGISLNNQAPRLSRNSSWSATSTSSYSGSVLGIDLDLPHDLDPDIQQDEISQHSVTPVWFCDRDDAMLDRDYSQSDRDCALSDREIAKCNLHTQEAKHSFTSSALTSLLHIAVAEGIVQQNLETPHVSFFSPSGNLIQAHARAPTPDPTLSPRSHSALYFSEKSATSLLHQDYTSPSPAEAALSGAVTLPPARLAPVRPTTSAVSTAPLPEHLCHRYDSQATEISHSTDCRSKSNLTVDSAVGFVSRSRGCGGVIRAIRHKPCEVPGLPAQPLGGGHSKKGPPCIRPCAYLALCDTSESPLKSVWSRAVPRKAKPLTKRPPRRREISQSANAVASPDAGLVAAHALRICFCQPYDEGDTGLGRVGCSGITIINSELCRADTCEPEALDKGTPNARIVPRDGAHVAPGAQHGTARRDSAVSIGVWDSKRLI